MKKNKVIYLMNHHPKERVRKKNWHRFIKERLIRVEVNGNEYTFFDKGKLVRKLHRGE